MPGPTGPIIMAALLAIAAGGARAAEPVADFLGPRGCVIGPGAAEAAAAAGIDAAALIDFAERAAAAPDAVRMGEWLLVGPALCRMRFSPIESEANWTDPEAAASISALDDLVANGEFGCFMDRGLMATALQGIRDWDRARAATARDRLIAEGVRAGALVFYGDDVLRTPPGFAFAIGLCGAAPGMAAARGDHAVLMRHLDAIVRQHGAETPCGTEGPPAGTDWPDLVRRATGERYDNVWGWMELMMMAIAAGWYEDPSFMATPVARPPLCHIAAD